MANIPTKRDSSPDKVNMTESALTNIERSWFLAIKLGSPPIRIAVNSEITVDITKTTPKETDHFSNRFSEK